MKAFNKYTFFARYLPGLISILPVTLLYFHLTKRFRSLELKEFLESASFLLGISITFLVAYFVSMVIREFGTQLEKRYFNNRVEFPTNYMLLYENDKLPKQLKQKFGERIHEDFGLERLSESDEKTHRHEALKILHQASRFVCTKYQQHPQVKEANISYGFARNISGGLIISLPASIAGVIVGLVLQAASLALWSGVATIVFGIILILRKKWITENAEKYAYKLISVYLGGEK